MADDDVRRSTPVSDARLSGISTSDRISRTPKKESVATEKPLALRKTPRAAAGSNMYRGKKPRRSTSTGSSKQQLDTSSNELAATESLVDVKPTSFDLIDTVNGPESVAESPVESVSLPVQDVQKTKTSKNATPAKGRKRKIRSSATAAVADAPDVEPESGGKRSRKVPSVATSPSQNTSTVKDEVVDDDCGGADKNGGGDGDAADADGANDGDHSGTHDDYCWLCHRQCADSVTPLTCDVCPRSYHIRCLGGQDGSSLREAGSWVCPECRAVLRAENTDTRSPAMQMLDLEQLCSLLKFALARIKVLCPVEFMQPVDLTEFPTYQSYVVHPMDMGMLETNLKRRMYGSTESFLSDAKWLLHNCVVYNGPQHKLSQVAKALLKVCRQEMAEIEVCPDCYRNAHTKRGNWFVESCNLPHLLIWAKLKGFPYWPGKAMRIVSGSVDVRFFGAHDRAWISLNQCYLLSRTPPTPHKNKKRMFEQSMDELESHVRRLRERFGTFEYAPLRAPLVEQNIFDGVRAMLPQFEDPRVSATKPKNEEDVTTTSVVASAETSNNPTPEDNASDSASRSSQIQTAASATTTTTVITTVKPREESVRNLESTIERIFRKNKAKKSCSDKESGGDDSVASYSNFSAAIAAAASEANSSNNSDVGADSIKNKSDRPVLSNGSSNAATPAASDADMEDEPTETAAVTTAKANSKTGINGDGSESERRDEIDDDDNDDDDDEEEEGGLVIDTSTDDDDDDTKESKIDFRISPVSSQASGREAPDDDDDDDAAELPILERHSRQDYSALSHDDHSKEETAKRAASDAANEKEKPEEEKQERRKGETSIITDEMLVRRLRLELDRVRWQHRQEVAEAKHNADLVLLEMRRSLEAEKDREVAAIRRQSEADRIRAVRDAKRRQWCTVCLEEASLLCCWNTSYCDYPCQRKHWPLHVNTCGRAKTLSKSITDETNSEAVIDQQQKE